MSAARLSLALAVLLGAIAPASAQSEEAVLRPSCDGVFDLCGFAAADGALVIPRRFEIARPFAEGLAAVREAGLWGFVDPAGAYAIDPRFEDVSEFRAGHAEAVIDDRAGLIDRSGTLVIPPEFERAIPFGPEAALVQEPGGGHLSVRDLNLGFLFGRFDLHRVDTGRVTDEPLKLKWFVRPGDDGPMDRIWTETADGRFGLMDDRGAWIVPPRFDHVQTLHENRAIVAADVPGVGRRWGAVDGEGQIVIPLQHDWLSFFLNGYAIVGGPGGPGEREEGLIRPDGTIVGGRLFEEARRPEGERPAGVRLDGVWFTIDEAGRLSREEPDGSLLASCPQGLRVLRDGPGYAITDAEGAPAFPGRVDSVSFGISERGGVTGASIAARDLDCSAPIGVGRGPREASEWTYVRPDGTALVPDRWFTSTGSFSEGYALAVDREGPGGRERWFVLNEQGEVVQSRDDVRIARVPGAKLPDGEPIFILGAPGEERFVDPQGRPVDLPDEFVTAQHQQALQCQAGARIIGDGERFGIEGPDGAILVPVEHRAISCFRDGVAWAPDADRDLWCPIGPDGAFRDRPGCREAYYPMRVSHHYPESFAADPFESNVLWVRAWLRWGLGLRGAPPEWVGDGVRSKTSFSVVPFQ